jgi:hypothetical protein
MARTSSRTLIAKGRRLETACSTVTEPSLTLSLLISMTLVPGFIKALAQFRISVRSARVSLRYSKRRAPARRCDGGVVTDCGMYQSPGTEEVAGPPLRSGNGGDWKPTLG